jgi:hypothetical protein
MVITKDDKDVTVFKSTGYSDSTKKSGGNDYD